MDGQNPGPREPIWRNRRWQVPLRSWVALLALVFALNVLFAFCGAGAQSEIPFSDFVTQVKADNVTSAEFLGSQVIGQFVHPVRGKSDFLTEEPPGDSGLVQLLLDHHVQVSATQSSFQWLGNALNALSVVFMLLLLGSIA
ncbi:MAG: hypothetical protein QOJ10_1191, partial [Chloroflexota bacterium]|nr:hypothetical protein [Chloroflexota bacterium]